MPGLGDAEPGQQVMQSRPSAGSDPHAAVDFQDPAGEEIIADDELDGLGDFLHLAQSPERDILDELFEDIGPDLRDHLGVDVAGRDGADPDAELGELLGPSHGHRVNGGFRG